MDSVNSSSSTMFGETFIKLSGNNVQGCIGCGGCFKSKDKKCVFKNDIVNECIKKMIETDGIILGSPVYFADISANMKALLERIGMVSKANDNLFKYKAGSAVITVRRGGAIHAFDTLNYFLHSTQMYSVGGTYWNMVYGNWVFNIHQSKVKVSSSLFAL